MTKEYDTLHIADATSHASMTYTDSHSFLTGRGRRGKGLMGYPNPAKSFFWMKRHNFVHNQYFKYSRILIKSSLPYFAKARTLSGRGLYQD